MIKYLIIFSFLSTNTLRADESVFLDKDQKAPFSGYLLPESKLRELRNNTLERDTLKELNSSLKTSLDLQTTNSNLKDQKVNLLLEQNDKLAKTAYDNRQLNTWEKLGYFVAGILVTGLAIKGVNELYR